MRTFRTRPYVRDAVVLGAAVGLFGVSFGVAAASADLSPAKTCAISLLVFTGASQFAAVSVVASGGTIAAALGSALLLAARNAAYGVAMAPIVGRRGRMARRLATAQLVIDESTAMASAQTEPTDRAGAFWATGLAIYAFWNVGTLIGVLTGTALGDPETFGLDAAFPAGFVALLAPHLRRRAGWAAAASGALIAIVLVPLAPAGVPIIAAALAVLPAMLFVLPSDETAPAVAPE